MKMSPVMRSVKSGISLAVYAIILLYGSIATTQPLSPEKEPSQESLIAPHQDSPIEWWYLTGIFDHQGSLPDKGFEATFFRFATHHSQAPSSSPWAIRTIISDHAALTDTQNTTGRKFIWMEKTRRSFGESVSIKPIPFEIRLNTSYLSLGASTGNLHLREEFGGRILDLTLKLPTNPLWESPNHQLVTGDGPKDKAFYYSYPEVPFQGKLGKVSDKGEIKWKNVSGKAWFDHEWTQSTLGKSQTGWIWLGLRLRQGDLMGFQMETPNGPDKHRGGTFLFTSTHEKGKVIPLTAADIQITPLSYFRSPRTHICRPKKIQVTIKKLGIEGTVIPILSDQELAGSPPYWEGAVRFRSKDSAGEGYLEMTGKQDSQKCRDTF